MNIENILCYILGYITGIVFFIMYLKYKERKEDNGEVELNELNRKKYKRDEKKKVSKPNG